MPEKRLRHLVCILGDQLDPASAALAGFDPAQDRLWMAEVPEEATHVWSHKARIALFLAAMRHFAEDIRGRGWPLEYRRLGEHPHASLGAALAASLAELRPQRLIMVRAGDRRVQKSIEAVAQAHGVALEVRRPTLHRHSRGLCALGEWTTRAAAGIRVPRTAPKDRPTHGGWTAGWGALEFRCR